MHTVHMYFVQRTLYSMYEELHSTSIYAIHIQTCYHTERPGSTNACQGWEDGRRTLEQITCSLQVIVTNPTYEVFGEEHEERHSGHLVITLQNCLREPAQDRIMNDNCREALTEDFRNLRCTNQ